MPLPDIPVYREIKHLENLCLELDEEIERRKSIVNEYLEAGQELYTEIEEKSILPEQQVT